MKKKAFFEFLSRKKIKFVEKRILTEFTILIGILSNTGGLLSFQHSRKREGDPPQIRIKNDKEV